MNNFKKKLSTLLALTAALQGGTNAVSALETVKSEKSEVVQAVVPLSKDELLVRKEVLKHLAKALHEANNECVSLTTAITNEGNLVQSGDPELQQMLKGVNEQNSLLGSYSKDISDVRVLLISNDKKKIDDALLKLESKIQASSSALKEMKEAWGPLAAELKKSMALETKSLNSSKKALALSIKSAIVRIRESLAESSVGIKGQQRTGPRSMARMLGPLENKIQQVENNINKLEATLGRFGNMPLPACRALEDQARAYLKQAESIKERLGSIVNQVTRETYYSKLNDLEDNLLKCRDEAASVTQMRIEARVMTSEQRAGLLAVRSSIRDIIDNAMKSLDSERAAIKASNNNSLMVPISIEESVRLSSLVDGAIDAVSSQILTWDAILTKVRIDDVARVSWDPARLDDINSEKMCTTCLAALNNPNLSIRKKVEIIANAINAYKPGLGTLLLPVIRAMVEARENGGAAKLGSVFMDEEGTNGLGEAVHNSKSPLMWVFSGIGGGGKTTGAIVLAKAFGYVPFIMTPSDFSTLQNYQALRVRLSGALQQARARKTKITFILDEADVATCVQTDAAGRSIEGFGDSGEPSNMSGRTRMLSNTKGKWNFKLPGSQGGLAGPGGKASQSNDDSAFRPVALRRKGEAFGFLSDLMRFVDTRILPRDFGGFFSTSNRPLLEWPDEVWRRLSPGRLEKVFSKPTAKQLAAIVRCNVPNLLFSDGYSFDEGTDLIGRQAEKFGWKADDTVAAIRQIASAVRKPAEKTCSIPCKTICKLFAGELDFQGAISQTKKINSELERNEIRENKSRNQIPGFDDGMSDAETDVEEDAIDLNDDSGDYDVDTY